MPTVTANGVKIHYEVSGEGNRKVILLHGLMLSWRIWEQSIKQMPADVQCYALDMRGAGDSDKPAENYGYPTFAQDVSSFMKEMNIDKASVVGHSINGGTAIYLGANYSDQIEKVVLVSTFARISSMTGGGGGMQEMSKMFSTPPSEIDRYTMESILQFLVADTNSLSPDLVDGLAKDASKADMNAIMGTAMSPMMTNIEEELKKVTLPILVVQGDKDSLSPMEEAQFMSEAVPVGKLVVVEDCGHCPMIERPSYFAAALSSFLTS
ncbi:MAG: alpha/beta hydrolase [Chloroflexota bacterium]|nr:alpha/beta hydrolase [Chloroflexota bacterium]